MNMNLFLNALFEGMTIHNPEKDIPSARQNLPTNTLAKAVLAMILMAKYKDKVSNSMEYEKYDGSMLPSMSGYSLLNAVTTYVDHGGDKTEAIEKFIDKHLRSPEQLEELINYLSEKMK